MSADATSFHVTIQLTKDVSCTRLPRGERSQAPAHKGKMSALTALQEREQISLTITRNGALRRGDKWFLLANRWWLEWVAYVDFEETGRIPGDARRPGPIDNSPLLEGGQLRKGIVEDQVR